MLQPTHPGFVCSCEQPGHMEFSPSDQISYCSSKDQQLSGIFYGFCFCFFFVSRPRCEQRSSSLFQPCVESLPTYVNNIKHALITFNSFRRLHNHPYHLFLFGSGTEPKRNRFLGFECHNHLLVFHHVHPLQTY